MDYIVRAVIQAVQLITSFDDSVISIASLSIRVSLTSTLIASLIGIPIGFILGTCKFRGRSLLTSILNTLLSIPTVVVGLAVYSVISRRGPLGELGLLFTPTAIIIGQTILALPIISALTMNATRDMDRVLWNTAVSLGSSRVQAAILLLKHARFAIVGAVIAGFGRVVAEVGASMMLGGNIANYTRTLTTAISLETSKGDFSFAIALGIILLLVSFSVNLGVYFFQQWTRRASIKTGERYS